ncbi:MAB_1171c family putative transporter [Nocardia sp. NPDC088792]|uniref:MAB_1171c family putative transporter n=1 Tax=Nocardia sp. NPDC088792 TaxID=3364332 RepID=UPI00382986B4
MITIETATWTAVAVMVWMLSLVVHRPHDVRLRSITTAVVCWAAGLSLVFHASEGTQFLGLEPMWSQLAGHILMTTGAYCLVCFFTFAAFDEHEAIARAKRHGLVLVVVVVVLVTAAVTIPADLRTAAAALTATNGPRVRGATSIGVFYTAANCFLLYAFLSGALSSLRAARYSRGGLRRALLITMTGLATLVVAFMIFAVGSIVRWAGGMMPAAIRMAGIVLTLPGFALFLTGISVPAAITRLAARRAWLHHLHAYHALTPLWTLLHTEFPEGTLTRSSSNRLLDRMRVTGVHRRFYRRVIECRDGLVRISPYVAHVQATGPSCSTGAAATLAHQLRQALQVRASGLTVPERAVPIAVPTGDGLDDDVHELLALADALRTSTSKRT